MKAFRNQIHGDNGKAGEGNGKDYADGCANDTEEYRNDSHFLFTSYDTGCRKYRCFLLSCQLFSPSLRNKGVGQS